MEYTGWYTTVATGYHGIVNKDTDINVGTFIEGIVTTF